MSLIDNFKPEDGLIAVLQYPDKVTDGLFGTLMIAMTSIIIFVMIWKKDGHINQSLFFTGVYMTLISLSFILSGIFTATSSQVTLAFVGLGMTLIVVIYDIGSNPK